MIRLTSRIEVGQYVFNGLVSCKINSSWEDFTDTMTITFPRRLDWGDELHQYLAREDEIKVYLGYNGYNKLAFQGFVKSISSTVPIEVECEDAACLLKRGNKTISYRNASLSQVLEDIVPATVPVASQPDNLGLGPFRMSNMTAAKILDEIKKNYFQKFWFRDGKLYAGLAYWPETSIEHKLHFQRNIIDHDLIYLHEEDVKIQLKIISVDVENRKTEHEYGDPEGETRTLYYYGKSKADIDAIADTEIDYLKYTGYRGFLTTFGEPFVNHGDYIELSDEEFPEREGKYIVKAVNRSFGSSGYRQEIELDRKVA